MSENPRRYQVVGTLRDGGEFDIEYPGAHTVGEIIATIRANLNRKDCDDLAVYDRADCSYLNYSELRHNE